MQSCILYPESCLILTFSLIFTVKMIEFRNPDYIVPPGMLTQILSHPSNFNDVVELSVFQEHRYAFFSWWKWTRKMKITNPPCLVSLDWHQDLCYPCNTEKEWLADLDISNRGNVAIFSWAKLAGNNDGHILAAAYLNLIGNIYVHCRQSLFEDWKDEKLTDLYGNEHIVMKFKTYEALEQHMLSSSESNVYFDIDLDFFTYDNPYNAKGKKFTYMSPKEISDILNVDRPLIQWIFDRLCGFTIATEPTHCGGLLKSNKLLDIINKIYFKPDLFTPNVYNFSCKWKHLIQ